MTRDDDIRRREREKRTKRNLKWRADLQAKAQEAAKIPKPPKVSLKPRKPLKRATAKPQAIRKRVKPVSDAMAADLIRQAATNAVYLAENPDCHHCIELGVEPRPSECVHHTAGKTGEMRFDRRFFMAVNSRCHTIWPESIHENTGDAHERGWLLSRDAPLKLKLAELIEKRGGWPHVKRELEDL